MMNKQQHEQLYFLPFIMFVIAVCFLASLLFTIKEDVFFSGDAGLKFLMVKQIAKGGSFAALHLESPFWVNKIWSQGFYPFKVPFVYDASQGKIVSFPPAFQWLSSWLYKWFGWKGLYILPVISLTGLWFWFIMVMLRAGIKPIIISLGFFLLAFCSPLTFYGAVYWEHTTAILLMFSAVAFLITPQPSFFYSLLSGMLLGVSVWFRPEMLLLWLFFITTVLIINRRKSNLTNGIFIASSLIGIVTFFIFNAVTYSNILGAHSFQLSDPIGFIAYIRWKMVVLTHLNARDIIFFPLIILIYALAIYNLLRKSLFPLLISQLTAIIILFSLIVPFALPNTGGKQWSARYLLPLVPLVITTCSLVLNYIDINKIKKWSWFVLPPLVAYSLYINVYLAHKTLQNDYAYRVKPGLDFIKNEPYEIIIVQNQYIAQEFAALFEKKQIFLAEDQQSFNKLQQLLKAIGVSNIIYMAHDPGLERLPENLINPSPNLEKLGDYYFAEYNLK